MKIISKRRRRIIVYYRTFGPDDNNGVADELETIRKNGWLINEANLVFHVDGDALTNGFVANRIYLYDFQNNRPIFDYVTDASVGSNSKMENFIWRYSD
jgi:hypothetical protein